MKNLLMISGDRALAEGKHGAFYSTLEEFSKHWERIDIICPKTSRGSTSGEFEVEPLFGNVFIHSSPWPLLFQVKFIFRKGREIFKHHKFDLMTVHEYAPFYNGLGAYLLHFAIRVPYVLEIMHIPGLPKAGSIKESIYKYLNKLFIAIDVSSARAVRIINQKQTRDFLVKAGVPIEKIIYIPAFYIDLDIFRSQAVEKKYDLVYAARLEKNKGIDSLLKAVQITNSKSQIPIGLLIIGDGPEKKNIQTLISKYRLHDNVELAGWQKGPEDVARLFNQSRIFVNPSLNEGGPRVALEAMACGLPVVTTSVGVMVDIIKDGENGILCDWEPRAMAVAIQRMLEDENLQRKCAQAGLELVKQFERKKAIAYYAESLQKIAQKRLLVVTHKVNRRDQLLGFFVEWLKLLSKKVPLSVLCFEKGDYDLPDVTVTSLGREKGNSKIVRSWNFLRYIISHQDQYDTVFVHMNPVSVILGGWYWRLTGKKIIFWYTSKGVTLKLRLALWFSNIVLTASPESFRIKSSKVIVTGHGIDTTVFKQDGNPKSQIPNPKLKILSVGRISPVKNYEVLIKALGLLKERGVDFELALVGEPVLKGEEQYLKKLKDMIKAEGLESGVHFLGRIDHDQLPALYNQYDLFAHMSRTGSLDKTILEAMACGLSVVSSNDAAKSFLPAEYYFNDNDASGLAQAIEYASKNPINLREYVIENHNLDRLIDKIITLL